MASADPKFNYKTMYNNWVKKDLETSKIFTLQADTYLLPFKTNQTITQNDYDLVKYEKTNAAKINKLFLDIMPPKGKAALKYLMELLEQNGAVQLLRFLRDSIIDSVLDNTNAMQALKNWVQRCGESLRADRYVLTLRMADVISPTDLDNVNYEVTTMNKNYKLFLEIMPAKGKFGLLKLIELLERNGDIQVLAYLYEVLGIKDLVMQD